MSTTQTVVSSNPVTTSGPSTVHHAYTTMSSSSMIVETKTESSVNSITQAVLHYNESSAENEIKPIVGQTTQRPVLVTWSNIQTDNDTVGGKSICRRK